MADGAKTRRSALGPAAALVAEARLSSRVLAPLSGICAPRDQLEAYAIQDAVAGRLRPRLGPVVGHKIGATTPVMQTYLGIAHPCSGAIFARTVRRSQGAFHVGSLALGVECELAVRLGDALTPGDRPFRRGQVAERIDASMAAIEVVENRYGNWRSCDTLTLIADGFFGAGCVLGDERTGAGPDVLARSRARLLVNGREAGAGAGADLPSHPLDALVWLADNLAARGRSLRRGDVVLLGSLVETVWIGAGDEVAIDNDLLGGAEARFW